MNLTDHLDEPAGHRRYPRFNGDAPQLLRICLVSRAPRLGEGERALVQLAAGLRDREHQVFFLLAKRGEMYDQCEQLGFRCLHLPAQLSDLGRRWRRAAIRTSLRHLLKRERPDVIHASDAPSALIPFEAARGLAMTRVCHHRYVCTESLIDRLAAAGVELHLYSSAAILETISQRSPILAGAPGAVAEEPTLPLSLDGLALSVTLPLKAHAASIARHYRFAATARLLRRAA